MGETGDGGPQSVCAVYLGETIVKKEACAGILPAVLERLALYRKKAKRQMSEYEKMAYDAKLVSVHFTHNTVSFSFPTESAECHFKAAVFNCKQLAYKVQMNSMYGMLGVKNNGMQPCLPLAALTTGLGRQLIDTTKAFFEAAVEGSRVIYGDTVGLYKC